MKKKKEKNVIDEKLYKQTKLMIWVFTFIGVAMVSAILLSTVVGKGTYSVETTADKPYWCCVNGNDCWASADDVSNDSTVCNYWPTTVNADQCTGNQHNYCPQGWNCTHHSNGCYTWDSISDCGSVGGYATCPNEHHCTQDANGCYIVIIPNAYYYDSDGSLITACHAENGQLSACLSDKNPHVSCDSWVNGSGEDVGKNINSPGTYACKPGSSHHDNCCWYDVAGGTKVPDVTNYLECVGHNPPGIWTCGGNDNTQDPPSTNQNNDPTCRIVNNEYVWTNLNIGEFVSRDQSQCSGCEDGYEEVNGTCTPVNPPVSAGPVTTPPNDNPTTPQPTTPPVSAGPVTTPPNDNPTTAPTRSCYTCTLNGKSQSVYATSKAEAAKGATTLKGVTADNCKAVSDKYCEPILVDNCYGCVVNGKTKYTVANGTDAAATKTGGTNCAIVDSNKCNTSVNPPTGMVGIIMAWIVGILTVGYSFWYFRKTNENK